MAQFARDWSEYVLGAGIGDGISDFTAYLDAVDYTNEVIETPLSPSGRGFRFNLGGFTGAALWAFTGGPSEIPEGEVRLEYYSDTTAASNERIGISVVPAGFIRPDLGDIHSILSGSFDAGGGSNVWELVRRLNGYSVTNVVSNQSTMFTFYTDGRNQQRPRCDVFRWWPDGSATQFRVKTWWKDEPEPPDWTTVGSDSTYTASPGLVGFGRHQNANKQSVVTFWGLGTDGDPAPTGPVSGAPPPRRRPLIWVPY